MTKKEQIYKCKVCGNIIEVLHEGAQALVCCKQPMDLITENEVDAAVEKHVPVLRQTGNGYEVLVGEVLHPMEEKHYIDWSELIVDNRVYRKYLKPMDTPSASFEVKGEEVYARAYCNLHSLWKSN
jgi:superoxide reductase